MTHNNTNAQSDQTDQTDILTETTPLSDFDFFYMVDRTKDALNFPVHTHREFELNCVSNCSGARRIVGDSIERIGDLDLCFVGHGIRHGWEQADCKTNSIREITIQFPVDIFGSEMLRRNQMRSIKRLLDNSSNGIAFPVPCIMKVFSQLEEILKLESGFDQMIRLIQILHTLAEDPDARLLNRSTRGPAEINSDSRRLMLIQDFIIKNFRNDIRLNILADMAGMSPSSFSRFFKLRTGRSISDYIISIRLAEACRELMSTAMPIADICFKSGFNNVSNFNRIFKKNKGITPKEFREIYRRNKILI